MQINKKKPSEEPICSKNFHAFRKSSNIPSPRITQSCIGNLFSNPLIQDSDLFHGNSIRHISNVHTPNVQPIITDCIIIMIYPIYHMQDTKHINKSS